MFANLLGWDGYTQIVLPEKVTYETLVTQAFTFDFLGFPISTISKRLKFRLLESVAFQKEEELLSCPPLSSE